MPIYEYSCLKCSAQFEEFVRSMTAEAQIKCPYCGSDEVKKGWSLFGMGKGEASSGSFAASPAAGCNTGGT